MPFDLVLRCQATVNLHRPDRGAEHPCARPARYMVMYRGVVCGIHARAWAPRVLSPLLRPPRPDTQPPTIKVTTVNSGQAPGNRPE